MTLAGDFDDWRKLRSQAERAIERLTSEKFASMWLHALLPVLDRFVAAAAREPADAFGKPCARGAVSESQYIKMP